MSGPNWVTGLNNYFKPATYNAAVLPVVGGSNNSWGSELNEFLSVSLDATTGNIKDGAVGTTQAANDNSTKIATTAYVDTKIGFIKVPASTEIFNGTIGTVDTFQDLDVSAKTGAVSSLLFIQGHFVATGGVHRFAIKPKGAGSETEAFHYTGVGAFAAGCCAVYVQSEQYFYFTVMTDSAGVVQIADSVKTSNTIVLNLLGYVN